MKQAVILAGGKGTRLRLVSGDLPKSMVSVNGKPLLEHVIDQCVRSGITSIKLLVSYKKKIIEEWFGDGTKFGAVVEYIYDETPRGTSGALFAALPLLDKQFLVIYGDTYFDINLKAFWEFHENHGGDASIFLHPNDHPHDSDLVEVDLECKVKSVHGYPHNNEWKQNLVNAGLYVFKKKALQKIEYLPKIQDIAKDLFPLMLENQTKIYGYLSTEYIKDMGTPKRLAKVERDIKSGKVVALRKERSKAAIFLDRDGTINKEVNHLSSETQFELIEGAGDAICQINASGFLAVVVTNQPGIARGDLELSKLRIIHNKMDTLLGMEGAYIDRLYYCPHHPDRGFDGEVKALKFDCECRKPNLGMFMQAKKDLNISFENSWVVGDSSRDILSAQNAGMRSILVCTGHAGKDNSYIATPDFTVDNIQEAIKLILKEAGE